MKDIDPGLADVVVAETELSLVDGDAGRLVIRGYPLEALAGKHTFAAVAALLWRGELDAREVGPALGRGRARAFERLPLHALTKADGMEALRASLGMLDVEEGADLVAAVAVFAAAWSRVSRGLDPIAPDREADHAADILRMIGADPKHAGALDRYLVSVIDHGMNASTFTARVVTSTGADAVSALVAAVGALKGPLHGGAPGPVLDMLDAVGTVENADAWIAAELAAGRRIMGMGHRIYRVRDPRAAVLEAGVEALEKSERLALARAVEGAAIRALSARHPERALRANVEFYTAVLLEAIGLDRRMFSPMFAAGRAAGWWAHVLEQRAIGRLIRPKSRYVGP